MDQIVRKDLGWKANARAAVISIEDAINGEDIAVLDKLYEAQTSLSLAIEIRSEQK